MTAKALTLGLAALLAATSAIAADGKAAKEETGKEIAYDRIRGNCLACHAFPNDPKAEMPGNIAPPIIGMKARFPDKAKLRAQIWNAMDANPQTAMPPFGKHKILTEEEIDKVVDFVYAQ